MNVRHVLLAASMAAAPVATVAAQESPSTLPSASATVVMPCALAQAAASLTVDASTTRLETARQANSAPAMRTAVDEVDRLLRDLRAQLAPCAAAMQAQAVAPHAGHALPAAPGPAAAAPAPAAAAAHIDHAAPATPAAAPRTTPRAAGPRPAVAADSPAPAHAMPSMPPAAAPGRSAQVQSAGRLKAAPTPAANPDATPAGNAVTDVAQLTCASRVDPKTAPRMLHQGRMYYFCSERERAAFAKNPPMSATAPDTPAAPGHGH